EKHTAAYTADFSLSRLITDYIEQLFKERNIPENLRKSLFKYFFDRLESGIDEGYPDTVEYYSKPLAASLKKNIAQFSAFKETAFKSALEQMLTDGKGDTVPWSAFKKSAMEVSGDYNVRWLEAE